jgi:hypothetical protein
MVNVVARRGAEIVLGRKSLDQKQLLGNRGEQWG